ncbi:hypothetical protein EON65_00155 [archaeon]|nr:MAG: hypothetical protein EON65_00155 [archaeon]
MLTYVSIINQGDKERELGMDISPMCDRTNVNLCNMQMGFIEFVVAPLIIGRDLMFMDILQLYSI